ncbi:MAG: hypothetical protein PW788_08030 [Micavibrio sp.]|nr:hypothetical protein [Micavibrio sp.]
MGNIEHLIAPGLTVLAGLYLLALGSGMKYLPPKFMRGSMWVIALSVLVLLWGGSSLKIATLAPKYPASMLADKIRAEMSPPTQLDTTLRLDEVIARENTVVYNMTVLPDSHSGDVAAFADNAREELRQSSCNNADYRDTLKYASAIEMNFRDSDGKTLESLTITAKDCAP